MQLLACRVNVIKRIGDGTVWMSETALLLLLGAALLTLPALHWP